jgi:hypothetical protein
VALARIIALAFFGRFFFYRSMQDGFFSFSFGDVFLGRQGKGKGKGTANFFFYAWGFFSPSLLLISKGGASDSLGMDGGNTG